MPTYNLKITVDALDKASGKLKGVGRELSGLERTGGGAKRTLADIDGGLQSVATIAGGAAVVLGTLKTAFDFGKQGAQVAQLRESFERTGVSLEDLRDASLGTVSDFELMSSTMALLTGTSGEMRQALMDAAPRILEIAKAAEKANPALGDTSFLYQSLMTGLKKGQPLLIDNAGLVLKVGDANREYAKTLGKTVEQLTAEEETMALVNATLRAGDILIEQVGGTAASATDDFTRLETSLKNIVDEGKEQFVPFLADAAEGLELLLTWNSRLINSLEDHSSEMAKTSDTYEDYVAELDRAAEATGYLVNAQGDLIKLEMEGELPVEVLAQKHYVLSEAEWEAAQMAERFKDAFDDVTTQDYATHFSGIAASVDAATGSVAALGDEAKGLGRALASGAPEASDIWNQIIEGGRAAGMTAGELERLAVAMGVASETAASLQMQSQTLVDAFNAGLVPTEEMAAITERLSTASGYLEEAQGLEEEGEYAAAGALRDKADAISDALIPKMDEYKEKLGEMPEPIEELNEDINASATAGYGAAESYDAAAAALKRYRDQAALGIPSTPTPNYAAQQYAPAQHIPGRQHGGSAAMGAPYWIGEGGPELFVPGQHGTVVNNNFNQTVNASGPHAPDYGFAIMQAMVG